MAKLSLKDPTYNSQYTPKSTASPELTALSIANSPSDTTVGEAYKNVSINYGDTATDSAMDSIGSYYQSQYNQPVNDKDIYRTKLKGYQTEIDAVNDIYRQKLNEARVQGEGRLGEQRALGARSGVLGSDFANAQREETIGYNNEIKSGIGAEQAQAIALINGKANKDATDEIAAKRLAKQQGADSYLAYLGSRAERKDKKVSSIASQFVEQGIDPSTVDPSQLKAIAKTSGLTTDEILSAYATANATKKAADAKADLETRKGEADIAKIEADIAKGKLIELSEGSMLYDTETGETFKNPKTYAPKDVDSDVTPLSGQSPFVAQSNYSKLSAKQETQADSLNNLVRTLKQYKDSFDSTTGDSGINLFGEDSGLLQTKLNSIIFAAAQAEGTGALQQADREVIEQIVPNPTTVGGAFNAVTKGGKEGSLTKIEDQIGKYTANLANLGLTPALEDQATDLRSKVDAAGYDYDAMKADGLSDEEIEQSL